MTNEQTNIHRVHMYNELVESFAQALGDCYNKIRSLVFFFN
jgi:hypothetical protein